MMTPLQVLDVPAWAQPLLKELVEEGPVKMSPGTARCSADAKRLVELGLAVYENGALRLFKDCKYPEGEE